VDQPLVSALMPAYNAADTLPRAIESVRKQTYPNIEIVVVDDGSTDGTWNLLQQYDDIVAVRQENGGLDNARNRAAAEASGQILALLDADDEWHPQKTEVQLRLLERASNCGAVFTGRTFVRVRRAPFTFPRFVSGRVVSLSSRDVLLYRSHRVVLGASAIFDRRLFEHLGGFDEASRQERDLYARMAARMGRVLWIGLPLYIQHRSGASMSTNIASKLEKERAFLDLWLPGPNRSSERELDEEGYAELLRTTHSRMAKRFVKAGDYVTARNCLAQLAQLGGAAGHVRLAVRLPRLAQLHEAAARTAAENLGRVFYSCWHRWVEERSASIEKLVRWSDLESLDRAEACK